MPSMNVRLSTPVGESESVKVSTAIAPADSNIIACVKISRCRRSNTSASAPAGMPTRNTGRKVAVWTIAICAEVAPRSPISQAAPTLCINVPRLDTSWATKRAKKTRLRNGVQRRGAVPPRSALVPSVESSSSPAQSLAAHRAAEFPRRDGTARTGGLSVLLSAS